MGTNLTLAALGLVVAMWVSGDTLSGTAIRQWITVALSAKYYAVGWVALWVCTLLFCNFGATPSVITAKTRPAGSQRAGAMLADALDIVDSGTNRPQVQRAI